MKRGRRGTPGAERLPRGWSRGAFVILALVVVAQYVGLDRAAPSAPASTAAQAGTELAFASSGAQSADALTRAIAERARDVAVSGDGTVERLLPDDRDGSRHQRFIVRLAFGSTLLIAHNIDLAPRIESLQVGAKVAFRGEYVWNDKGGVVHWTHHDPDGPGGGWLEHDGRRYR